MARPEQLVHIELWHSADQEVWHPGALLPLGWYRTPKTKDCTAMSDRELNSRVLSRTRFGLYHVHPGSPGNSMSGLSGR
jgi:hypothetical protein